MLDGWLTPTILVGIKQDGSDREALVEVGCDILVVAHNVEAMMVPQGSILYRELMPKMWYVQKIMWRWSTFLNWANSRLLMLMTSVSMLVDVNLGMSSISTRPRVTCEIGSEYSWDTGLDKLGGSLVSPLIWSLQCFRLFLLGFNLVWGQYEYASSRVVGHPTCCRVDKIKFYHVTHLKDK